MPAARKSRRLRRQPGRPLPRPARAPTIRSPWSLRTVRGVQILELAPFKNLPWLVHGFSTRAGGNSVLDSGERTLNLGFMDWDTREAVEAIRQAFRSALGATAFRRLPLKQFHSAVIQCFSSARSEPCKGDASLTSAPGLLLAVQTADCVPILLVDPKKRAVAAIHAGWRGTLARIAEKTVGQVGMRLGWKPYVLHTAVGLS